jgi:hypothetical protein
MDLRFTLFFILVPSIFLIPRLRGFNVSLFVGLVCQSYIKGLAMYSAAFVKSFKYCGVAKTIPFGTAH